MSSSILPADEIRIPLHEIQFSYVRSSGPGGQNVNKVNSKAVLRWDIAGSPGISQAFRLRLLSRLADRLTTQGELVLMSDRFRDQGRNREDCIEKLLALVVAATAQIKRRKKTQPTYSSQRKKRESKSHQSEKKRRRGTPGVE